MARRLLLLAALTVVLVCLAAAGASAKVVVNPQTGHRLGITLPSASLAISVQSPRSLLAAPQNTSCASPCPLTLHSNSAPVQHAESVYLFFWDPSGSLSASYKSTIQTWLD